MTRIVVDLTEEKPGKLLVHFKTNDIGGNVNLLNNVKNIFRKVSKDSPSLDLAFSSIIVRKDKKIFERSILVWEKYAPLKNCCSQKASGYIENSGIKDVYLGKKRLFLNIKKVTMLGQNICSIRLIDSVLAKNLLVTLIKKRY